MNKEISKHILEIRFQSSPRILDQMGSITESLKSELFNHWEISNNRVDFLSEENKNIAAFFSYRNFGFISEYPNNMDFFKKQSEEFIKHAWMHLPNKKIIRAGLRSTFLIEKKDFKDLFLSYKNRFLKLTDEELNFFGGELIDVGFPLNFIDGENRFNIMTGPMEKKEASQFFAKENDLPQTSIFLDIDFSRKDFEIETRQKNILEFIDLGIQKTKNMKKTINNLLK